MRWRLITGGGGGGLGFLEGFGVVVGGGAGGAPVREKKMLCYLTESSMQAKLNLVCATLEHYLANRASPDGLVISG